MISIEEKNLVLTRVTDDTFSITFGDLEVQDDDIELFVGEKITIPVHGLLIQRNNGVAKMCIIKEDIYNGEC